MSLPTLKHIADIHLDLAPGLPCGATPKGTTTWFEITSGTITSPPAAAAAAAANDPPLHLAVLPGGGDYATVHGDAGVVSLDVHFLARQPPQQNEGGGDSGATAGEGSGAAGTGGDVFRFRNTGFIHLDNPAVAAVMAGDPAARSTEYGEARVLETITCQTSAGGAFGWMNWATMVAQGRLVVEGGKFVGIEFRVFEVEA